MSRARPTVITALRATLPRGSKLLLAVSGGADSSALLHAAVSLQKSLGLTLAVAHIDHGLREDSAADSEFVEQLAHSHKIPFYGTRLDKQPSTGIEAWGRKERYRTLAGMRIEHGFDWIVTAHTAQDAAETLLMRLFANKELGSILETDRRRKLLRPLLTVSRTEIVRYLSRNKLQHIEDPSNQSDAFLRNRIRNRVLTALVKEFGEQVISTLAFQSQALASELSAVRRMARSRTTELDGLSFGSREWLHALRAAIKDQPRAVKIRIVERAFLKQVSFPLGRRHGSRLLQCIEEGRGAVQLPSGISVRRANGGLSVKRAGVE